MKTIFIIRHDFHIYYDHALWWVLFLINILLLLNRKMFHFLNFTIVTVSELFTNCLQHILEPLCISPLRISFMPRRANNQSAKEITTIAREKGKNSQLYQWKISSDWCEKKICNYFEVWIKNHESYSYNYDWINQNDHF